LFQWRQHLLVTRHRDIEVTEYVTWYSITEVAASLARSVDRLRFEWLLPGHGGRKRLPAEEMAGRLRELTKRVQTLRPRGVDFKATRW
jgi:hypothetical protein